MRAISLRRRRGFNPRIKPAKPRGLYSGGIIRLAERVSLFEIGLVLAANSLIRRKFVFRKIRR